MEDLFNSDLRQYLEDFTSPEPELLRELNRETYLKVLKPRMLSGHVQGRFLSMISHLIQPKRILEIGTFTGYATLCLAEGLDQSGKIQTLESNPEHLILARKYFALSGLENKIEILEGDAIRNLNKIEMGLDLVFIDADKKNNLNYLTLVWNKVRKGGLVLVDNVLWSGKVLGLVSDPKTKAIQEFNEFVRNHEEMESTILPIRDGIYFIRKKNG